MIFTDIEWYISFSFMINISQFLICSKTQNYSCDICCISLVVLLINQIRLGKLDMIKLWEAAFKKVIIMSQLHFFKSILEMLHIGG